MTRDSIDIQRDIVRKTGREPRRILACQLRQIGDVLLATPALRLLQERFPAAELHVLTEAKCAPVLEHNPHVARVHALDKKALRNPLTALGWYRRVARTGYDLVVDLQQLPRCKWVVRFSGAPVRLTFTPPWYNRRLYTHWTDLDNGYAAKCTANVLRPLGIEWDGGAPELFLSDDERAWAGAWLAEQGLAPGSFVTVDPSHRRITRKWPERHFAGLMRLLAEQRPGTRFLVLYGPGEQDVAREVARLYAGAGDDAVLPPGLLTLRQMAAVQEAAAMHLGNCSAPRHFAVAVGAPSMTILGATSTGWQFPSEEHAYATKGLPCHPCNRNDCEHRRCLEDLEPEEVLADALRVYDLGRAR